MGGSSAKPGQSHPQDTDPERGRGWLQVTEPVSGPFRQARAPGPHPQSPGQAGLRSPNPCRCRHPAGGSREWPGGAQQSPQRKRRLRRPGGAPRRVRWGEPGVRLGPELGKTHKDGPEGWLLCQAESHLRDHSCTQIPGFLGAGGPLNRHLLGPLSVFRPPPKPTSLSSPGLVPAPSLPLRSLSFILEGAPKSASGLPPSAFPNFLAFLF